MRWIAVPAFSNNRRSDWRDWLAEMGHADFPLDEMEMIEFPNSMLAYQAAADGLGIVIGQVPVLGPEFAAQSLVPLFGRPIRQGSYCAVWRAETTNVERNAQRCRGTRRGERCERA